MASPEEQATMSERSEAVDMARELYAHRKDSDEWEDEPAAVEVRPARTAVVSVRVPVDEFEQLSEAAAAAGRSISEYVREAITLRMTGMAPGATINTTTGAGHVQLSVGATAWSHAPHSYEPAGYQREIRTAR